MTERQTNLHWMRDILDHLRRCQEQLPLVDEPGMRYLAESMKRDIDEFRRLCESLLETQPTQRRERAAAAA